MRRRRGTLVAARWLAPLVLAALLPARGAAQAKLFRSDSVLEVTLRTDLRGLRGDRDTTKAPTWRGATLSYAGSEGPVSVPLRVRARGIWRRANCDFPPIHLHFSDSAARGTLFHGLHHAKLVVPCRGPDLYEQLILQEYAVYRVLQLLTPASLATRLLRVTYEDEKGRMRPSTRYAFVTEEPDRLAERLHGFVVTGGVPLVSGLSAYQAALLGTFQYFVGNTDWSMPGRHNIAVLVAEDSSYAVPFDFDWTGVVNAPYAKPLPILPIRTVQERLWRGRCQSAAELEPILARFEALRDTITALYRAIPGLEPREAERTEQYYGEFYRAIADRARFARRVVNSDCRP
ncbi:MAG TPA: hypothetical protein VMT21_04560 [Gemmatimonadales bacterium]|nr:hypothetical protein [Gemmatimonadales bacterium]